MLSLAAHKIAKRSLSHRIDLAVADGQNPPVREQCCKACVLYGVVHHLSEKKMAIANVASKLVPGGHYFSLDPHKSKIRFLFDFLMKFWKLYVEEASDDPLITRDMILEWTRHAGLAGNVIFSTILPPHLFFWGDPLNKWLLETSDNLFIRILKLQSIAGVIIFEGKKQNGTT
jgi:SAM-dependent methyltransferase